MRPSVDRPTRDSARQLRRWAPIVVIVVVVAVVAAVLALGGKNDKKKKTDVGTEVTGKLPSGAISFSEAKAKKLKVTFPKTCDTKRGFVAIPFYFAGECFANVKNNGGATAQGVTAKAIKVVVYSAPENDPIINFITAAIKNDDTRAQGKADYQTYTDLFNRYYQTYGRKVEIQFLNGSGNANDEVAARADAVKAAGMKPFAVWGGPVLTSAFADELAARHVICLSCLGGGLPDWYEKRKPYAVTIAATASQGNVHLVEYIDKQLAGGKATKAGDPAMQTKPRKFGEIYIEVNSESTTVAKNLKADLKAKGVELVQQVAYTLDPARLQEQAASAIAKLKSAGVTSVIFSGDPVAPANFTSEATRQDYFPEWVMGPSALVDTAAFARTYDQKQWAHAFGLSTGSARTSPDLLASYALHKWFTGKPPAAANTSPVLFPQPSLFFAGVQAAGPDLTSQSFANGLFALRPREAVTQPEISYGKHGFWPYTDYNGIDDAVEIWWDPTVSGADEIHRQGQGLYRYVDGGRRHEPGQWPTKPSTALDRKGTVTILKSPPRGEGATDYPSPAG